MVKKKGAEKRPNSAFPWKKVMSVCFHSRLIFGNKFWKFSNIWKDWVKISGSIIGKKKRQKTKNRQKPEKQKKARKLFAAKFSYAAKLIS